MKYLLPVFFLFILLAFDVSPNESHLTEDTKNKIDKTLLKAATNNEKLNFIILLKNQAHLPKATTLATKSEKGEYVFSHLREMAQSTQRPLLQILEAAKAPYKSHFLINAIQVEGSLDLVYTFAERPDVKKIISNPYVRFDQPVKKSGADLRGPDEIEWGIEKISADEVWNLGFEGEGVVIGGQDTGYDWEHPALKEKYRGWNGSSADHNYNWHDAIRAINPLHGDSIIMESNNRCGFNSPFPCDDGSHGTHTMGIMVGSTDENKIGIAPKSKWIACRNMERGYGTPSTYIECFEWFLAPTDLNNQNPDPSKAPHVINNSWSCPELEGCTEDIFPVMEMVVENLKKAGVVVVVSAGNSGRRGCATINTPSAIYEASFTIGASNQLDSIADFSSRGPVLVDDSRRLKPNVVAPGVSVRSSTPNGAYASFSGTSMSGPHVAGVVALMISANPSLAGQVETIENIIELTSKPLTAEDTCGLVAPNAIPNTTYGYGRVNAFNAVNKAIALSPDLAESSARLYPNPVLQDATIEIINLPGNVTLDLFNVSGQRIQTIDWSLSNYEILTLDLQHLHQGIYFYQLSNGEKILKGKVMKL